MGGLLHACVSQRAAWFGCAEMYGGLDVCLPSHLGCSECEAASEGEVRNPE